MRQDIPLNCVLFPVTLCTITFFPFGAWGEAPTKNFWEYPLGRHVDQFPPAAKEPAAGLRVGRQGSGAVGLTALPSSGATASTRMVTACSVCEGVSNARTADAGPWD